MFEHESVAVPMVGRARKGSMEKGGSVLLREGRLAELPITYTLMRPVCAL